MNYQPTPELQKWWTANYAKMRNDSSFTKATIVWNAATAAASAAAPQVVADERAAFEAQMRSMGADDFTLRKWIAVSDVGATYRNPIMQDHWKVWQARAALAAAPVQHIPANFSTHRIAWRDAINECINVEQSSGNADQAAYWQHELAAFDRSFDRLLSGEVKIAPVQAQEPVAEVTVGGLGIFDIQPLTLWAELPVGTKLYRAPVQPVAVPDDCDCDDGLVWKEGCTSPCYKCQNVTDDSAAPAAQGDAKGPDMLWDAEDAEGTFANSADEFAVNYASDNMIRGDVSMVEILCAVQIENRTMRIEVTDDDENPVKWEWVDAAIAAKAAS